MHIASLSSEISLLRPVRVHASKLIHDAARRRRPPRRADLRRDAAANALILLALRTGDLAVVSALTALYPAGTIILASVVLRERVAAVQWVGLGLALTAGGLLAIA
ncbi:EamA family transporter [Microbacterium sp. NPDC056736]|uniref:EamA family transporter n=1 Tax=Microbacterium sp. NPDC056736 TaxID=3345932 RepID=UPI00366EA51F